MRAWGRRLAREQLEHAMHDGVRSAIADEPAPGDAAGFVAPREGLLQALREAHRNAGPRSSTLGV